MEDKLIATGLTKNQAEAYALLVERGEITPPIAAIKLNLTRTNTYKLLDKLVELGLAKKVEGKKATYALSNPLGLASLVADLRGEVKAREEAINSVMGTLLATYYEHTEQPSVEVVSGQQAVADAFRKQIGLHENIYFIHSRIDVPLMGFDTMHEIRTSPSRHGLQRFGILPDRNNAQTSIDSYKRTNLTVTWTKLEDYDAPVEWSVTSSSLMIVLYGKEPHAITIMNPIVAQSFLQLWHLLDTCLRAMPYYKTLPRSLTDKKLS